MLLRNGTKLTGVLQAADEQSATLAVAKEVKPEGGKRKVKVFENQTCGYDEIKYTKNILRFK
jgi:ribosome maturation factor RimP